MGRLKTVYIRRFNISEIVEMLRIFFFSFRCCYCLSFSVDIWGGHMHKWNVVWGERNTKIAEGMKCQRAATRVRWQWAKWRKEEKGRVGKGVLLIENCLNSINWRVIWRCNCCCCSFQLQLQSKHKSSNCSTHTKLARCRWRRRQYYVYYLNNTQAA